MRASLRGSLACELTLRLARKTRPRISCKRSCSGRMPTLQSAVRFASHRQTQLKSRSFDGGSAMGAQGVVVLPGQGSVWNVSPGRSLVLKLLGGATEGSIMLFEETVPTETKSWFHLHHDSDEVAYVLSGEITFKIGDEVTIG